MLRPAQAHWFETYVPRDHTVRATQVLAETGVVQLELDPRLAEPVNVERLRFFVERFQYFAAPCAADLPKAGAHATAIVGNPVHIANAAVHAMRVWSARFDYVTEHLSQLRAERTQLALLAECLEGMRRQGLDLDGVLRMSQFLCKCLFACPRGEPIDPAVHAAVAQIVHGNTHDFFYIADLPERRHLIEKIVGEDTCTQIGIPAWVSNDHGRQRQQIAERQRRLDEDSDRWETELETLRRDATIGRACANVEILDWYLNNAAGYLSERELCHVTGWTMARDPHALQQALDAAGISAVVRFPHAPVDVGAPVVLFDAWWARPFQPLLTLWGTPGRTEVDPSGLLALIVPLLFGYMFPDVGHGLLLMLFGALMWRRSPQLRFLLPCGIAAIGFGFVFGDIFGFDDIVAPLWMHSLDDPLAVLIAPLIFGIGLMLLGLILAGVEAAWNRELPRWLAADAPVLLIYASLLAAPLVPQVLWLLPFAVLLYFAGNALFRTGRLRNTLIGATGDLLISVFELLINTLSFVRVGAFALGHAALSTAVMTLAHAADTTTAFVVILVIGHLFSVVLEALLVFVQTTRLVLFEFFTRFLRAEGRLFRPLRKPTTIEAPANV